MTREEAKQASDWFRNRSKAVTMPGARRMYLLAIEALSAQSQRKTGKWILTDFPDEQTYKCSACNAIWTFIEGTPIDNGAYFCPNCGADMRQMEDDNV